MKVTPIQPRDQGNLWYPLPPDYPDLTASGARQARVNACRQWLLPGHRTIKGDRFAECIRFFFAYYLTRETAEDGTILFDPLFLSNQLPTPSFHWQILRSVMAERKTAFVGPRGSAKTKGIFAPTIMLPMLSRPVYGVTYATSTNELAEEMGDTVKYQLYENSRINDDWSPEYSNRIKPSRSEGKMGMGAFKLSNRSSFFATSAQSRQRGHRPELYLLDDPEWDPRHSTSVEVLAEGMEQLLFSIALPMIQQADTHIVWGGTFISLRHYLWKAMQVETVIIDGAQVDRPIEPRFGSWNRIIVPAMREVSGKMVSCWPYMWPVDNHEKKALDLPETVQTLRDIEEEIGPDRFQTEYMAKPGSGLGTFFPALTDDDHWFFVKPETMDEDFITSPHTSKAILTFKRRKGSSSSPTYTTVDLPLSEVFSRFPRIIVADASDTSTRLSDRKTSFCFFLTDHNELFFIDLWSDQCDEDAQCEAILSMADRWRVLVVHPEDIKSGKHLKEALFARVATQAKNIYNVQHMPGIGGFNPGQTDKQTKIKSIRWRFAHGQIKLPAHLRHEPVLKRLVAQIQNFHPYADNGGLEKDDELDTLSMPQYIIKGLSAMIESQATAPPQDAISLLKSGKRTADDGSPLLAHCAHLLTLEDLNDILSNRSPSSPSSLGPKI